jgi:hypothetical protein
LRGQLQEPKPMFGRVLGLSQFIQCSG